MIRNEMIAHVAATVADPVAWLLAVRAICERARLDPARCIPLGETLDVVCFHVCQEAAKQRRTLDEMRAAIHG